MPNPDKTLETARDLNDKQIKKNIKIAQKAKRIERKAIKAQGYKNAMLKPMRFAASFLPEEYAASASVTTEMVDKSFDYMVKKVENHSAKTIKANQAMVQAGIELNATLPEAPLTTEQKIVEHLRGRDFHDSRSDNRKRDDSPVRNKVQP